MDARGEVQDIPILGPGHLGKGGGVQATGDAEGEVGEDSEVAGVLGDGGWVWIENTRSTNLGQGKI